MILKSFISIIVLFLSNVSTDDFFLLKLNDLDNKLISFNEFKKNKATVMVFLLVDCPASESYTLTLNRMSKKYMNENIDILGIFPGNYATDDEMKKFRNDFKIKFPILKDPGMILARKLDASIAPGCFLVDSTGKIVYSGRIDNWMFALGKKRKVITEHNLEDAIQSVLKNEAVKIPITTPIGCILEYD